MKMLANTLAPILITGITGITGTALVSGCHDLAPEDTTDQAWAEYQLTQPPAATEIGLEPEPGSPEGISAQSMFGVDGILDMCLNTAAPWNEFHECIFDLDTQSITFCSPALAGSVQVPAFQPASGLVVDVDLDGWDAMLVAAVADSVSNYAFHIGNDPNNNGWAGGTSLYDSEAHLYNNTMRVYRNDLGGSSLASALGNAIPNPSGNFCSTQNGAFCATVRDGYFGWLREDPTDPNGVSAHNLYDPNIFRVDTAAGANDSVVHVGFEHVVQVGSGRSGADLQSEVRIVLLR